MKFHSIPVDDETYERLEALAKREGKPIGELVKAWMESALLAAGVVRNLHERDVRREALQLKERAARAKVQGFSARDNLERRDLYRE